jgi:DNA processing protein
MDLIKLLRIARSVNIGPVGMRYLINQYGDQCIDELQRLNVKWRGREVSLLSEEDAQKEIDETLRIGGQFVTFDQYPLSLQAYPDIPYVLTYKGNINLLYEEIVGVVGMRHPSVTGVTFTNHISKGITDNGYVVASGCAIGIDSAAHSANVARTIGVLPSGLDSCYPKSNSYLIESISQLGLLITDVPLGMELQKSMFFQRNKIIAALSKCVCVMESGLNSGSLSTIEFAISYGKYTLAVPGHPSDYRYQGNNGLLKTRQSGMLLSIDDVIGAMNSKPAIFRENSIIFQINKDKAVSDIYDALLSSWISINDLCMKTSYSMSVVMSAIGELDCVGQVMINGDKVCKNV